MPKMRFSHTDHRHKVVPAILAPGEYVASGNVLRSDTNWFTGVSGTSGVTWSAPPTGGATYTSASSVLSSATN